MRYILLLAMVLIATNVFAGDLHQDDETHTVIYSPVNSSGDFQSGLLVRLTVKSFDNVSYFDFSDSIWKNTADLVTPFTTMNEDNYGGFYWYPFTMDSATLVSGDYVFIVSNEDATFGTVLTESVTFTNTHNLIRIHR